MVEEFMRACQPQMVREEPEFPTEDLHTLRSTLIYEEWQEFDEADNLTDMADAICDLLYVVYGAATSVGIDIEPLFAEVHRSNMQKLNGPIRADGKQLKPDNWQPPNLKQLITAQYSWS